MDLTTNPGEQALAAFKQLLTECHQEGLPLVLLRERPVTCDAAYTGDYDFILDPKLRHQFLRMVLRIMSERDLAFQIKQTKLQKLSVYLYDPGLKASIRLELWSHIEVKDPAHRTLNRIFWEDLYSHIHSGDKGYRLTSRVEALCYLSHLYTKNKSLESAEVAWRLNYYAELMQKTGDLEVLKLYTALNSRQELTAAAASANSLLLDMGILRNKRDMRAWWREKRESCIENWHRKRMDKINRRKLIPLVGPDGVGKTTLIEGMKAVLPGKFRYFRFKMQFRKSWLYRILYPLLRNSLRRHLGCNPSRNQVDDAYGGFTLMTGLIRYPLLRLRTWLAGYYLMDRYFYDHLLVNLRFFNRPNRLLKGWSTWLRFIPRPFWLIQLDAPSEVILSRKKQLTPQDIETVRQWMFEFYLQKPAPYYLYINTSLPEDVCLAYTRSIVGKLKPHHPFIRLLQRLIKKIFNINLSS